jgi:uncharacterized protein YnzC (UPF0291/DUF896 family)
MVRHAIIKYGHFMVDPDDMQDVIRQQELNEEEIERIVKYRWMYLDWMHKRFADKVVKPPE